MEYVSTVTISRWCKQFIKNAGENKKKNILGLKTYIVLHCLWVKILGENYTVYSSSTLTKPIVRLVYMFNSISNCLINRAWT